VSSPFEGIPDLPPALLPLLIDGAKNLTGLVPLLGPGGPCA
jgi:hypothetical protein